MARTVLVIDDSASVRVLWRAALEGAGYEVVEAGDGEQAMGMLDGRSLGAILCDLAMPQMDGMAFLRHLRQHPRYKFTPLMLVTTESRPEAKAAARAQGAQAFLNKPCTPTQLVSAVQRLCA